MCQSSNFSSTGVGHFLDMVHTMPATTKFDLEEAKNFCPFKVGSSGCKFWTGMVMGVVTIHV